MASMKVTESQEHLYFICMAHKISNTLPLFKLLVLLNN